MTPSIVDYLATLNNPVGVFRTLFAGAGSEPVFERDLYGELRFRAGNSAAVFTFLRDGQRRFLKLYVRPNPYLREIYDYVERVHREGMRGADILPRVRLLRDELFVLSPTGASGLVDVVEGEWVEGKTLDRYFPATPPFGHPSLARRGNSALAQLAAARSRFDDLCDELRAAEWAHGDLKPDNIVVRPDGGMTLIDCDAMWIPAFGERTADYPAGRPAVELGTPPWADPRRTSTIPSLSPSPGPFDKSIDDHPVATIREWLRDPVRS